MNISSLLNGPSESRAIPEPVVLAPHLKQSQHSPHSLSQQPNNTLEALVNAAEQERRRYDPSSDRTGANGYSHHLGETGRESDLEWAKLETKREPEKVGQGQRPWEGGHNEREQREQWSAHHQRRPSQSHSHPQQYPERQSNFDQSQQGRYMRQQEQRQVHRESILGYPLQTESPHSQSHPQYPSYDQQTTHRHPSSPSPNLVSPQHHVSRLPRVRSPAYPTTEVISQSRSQPTHPPPPSSSEDELDRERSSKKRRHSDSVSVYHQSLHHSEHDLGDRLDRHRELMTSSGLGYGRSHPSSRSIGLELERPHSSSRKPGSSGYSYDPVHDQGSSFLQPPQRPSFDMSISDDKGREQVKNSIGFITSGIEGNSRDYHTQPLPSHPPSPPPGGERVISPAGRRSPPGSQTGRVLASRHHEHNDIQDVPIRPKFERRDSSHSTTPLPPSHPIPPTLLKAQSSEAKEKEKEKAKVTDKKKGRSRTSNDVVVRQDDPLRRAHKLPTNPYPPVTAPPAIVPKQLRGSDEADDWFLSQFENDTKSAQAVLVRPSSPPPAPPPLTATKRHSKSPLLPKPSPNPEDPVAILELELAGDDPRRHDGDMDVDRDVDKLMEETFEDDDDDKCMDVDDVDNELLSLIDDDTPLTTIPALHRTISQEGKSKPSVTVKTSSRPESPAINSPAFRSPSGNAIVSDRESMPPPAAPSSTKDAKSKKNDEKVAGQPKKRGKPGPKPKPRNPDGTIVGAPPPPLPKPRGKPGPKPKPRDANGNIIRDPVPAATASTNPPTTKVPKAVIPPALSRSVSASQHPRSRSTSAMPGGSVGPEGEGSKTEEGGENPEVVQEDDKLYCVCKTRYDEDRSMIACDTCDEWYHTQCVKMADHLVDLVDQFVCPPCIAKNPSQNLKTTYKSRCLYGLLQPDPDSPKACHKPARTYSKYCSDECGIKNVSTRLDFFVKRGGDKAHLWETVKNAEKREGLVRCLEESMEDRKPLIKEVKPKKTLKQKEVDRLATILDDISRVRDELKKGMEIIAWREDLIELASKRAKNMVQCGWDQRLCFGEQEWTAEGIDALESYNDDDDKMDTDSPVDENKEKKAEKGWWCSAKGQCERHAGWQNLRAKEVAKEKEKKLDAINKLTSKERDIRKHLESLLDLEDETAPAEPLKLSNKQCHGNSPTVTKKKLNGESASMTTSKKGKKRKAPT